MIAQTPDSLTNRINPEKVFGRKAALHVDLGCGDGSFLCALAQRFPGKNFIGIERLSGRVRTAARKAAGLSNVRLLQIESSYAVRYLLPAESVATFYLLFPDPWPKRRHQRRRIVTPDFLISVHAALEDDGEIYVATDHGEYFEQIKALAESTTDFVASDAYPDLPPTKFGIIFQNRGALVHWLALRRISPAK